MSKPKIVEIPDGLSESAAAVWRELAPTLIYDSASRVLLLTAVRFFDLSEQARRARKRQTIVTSERGGPRAHPLCKLEASCHDRFSRIVQSLQETAEKRKPKPAFNPIPTADDISAMAWNPEDTE